MQNFIHAASRSFSVLAFLFLPLFIFLNIPNNAGDGLNMPGNLLTAGLLALFAVGVLLYRWRTLSDLLGNSPMSHALLLMLFYFTLAVILQEDDLTLMNGVLRLGTLIGITILWLLLGQLPSLQQQKFLLLAGIVLFSTLQALA